MLIAPLLAAALAVPIPTRIYDCTHVAPARPYVERTVTLRVEGAGRVTAARVVATQSGAVLIETQRPTWWAAYQGGYWASQGLQPWAIGRTTDAGFVVLVPQGVLGSTFDGELHEVLLAGGWLQDYLSCTAR
jgi:hypothetical protein